MEGPFSFFFQGPFSVFIFSAPHLYRLSGLHNIMDFQYMIFFETIFYIMLILMFKITSLPRLLRFRKNLGSESMSVADWNCSRSLLLKHKHIIRMLNIDLAGGGGSVVIVNFSIGSVVFEETA